MKIRRLHFLFIVPFTLMTIGMLDTFKKSAAERINTFAELKSSPLPVVSIQTDGQKAIKSKEKYRRATAYFFNNAQEAIEISLSKNSEKSSINSFRCKIRGRGNSTWNLIDTHKHSYLLKLDEAESFFGFAPERKWVLQANVTDKTSLRNVYSYHLGAEIFNKAGWSPKTQFVNLFINDKFLGLYGFMEKAEISPSRVNLPLDIDDDSFLAEVNSRLNQAWNFRSDKGVKLSIREKKGANQDYYRNAEQILKEFEEVLFSEHFSDTKSGYAQYIDVESFVDWYLVNEITKNHDAWFQSSCFMYYSSQDRRIHMGPIWDFDISCGNISYHDCENPEGLFIQSRHWYKRLWEDEAFRSKVAKRWQECRSKLEESFLWLEEEAAFLETSANLDDKIWQRFGYRQWPHAPGWQERKTYQAEVEYMENWLRKRVTFLDAEFYLE